MVYRIYVEKKPGFDGEAQSLRNELVSLLGIKELSGLRLLNRYDVEGIDEALFEQCVPTVFSEPPVDNTYAELPAADGCVSFAVEYLPGQFDQRADSAAECIQLISQGERPLVRSARVYLLEGTLTDEQLAEIKKYVINPVEAREASLDTKATLKMEYPVPTEVAVLDGFNELDEEGLKKFIDEKGLAMDLGDIKFCQEYFRSEKRDPTITEIKMIDTYWSDHCRHTTFGTILDDVQIDDAVVQKAFDRYMAMRADLGRENKPRCMMDLATIGAKELKKQGILKNLDESEEINACTVKIKCDVNGKDEDWLFLFKNETHNHPTEIEPFGGAATCIGGAIRDPLSGRSYVYQAMRVTGAGDPLKPVSETLPGKLPQRKLVTTAAAGYSSYGNQIGLATGHVAEIYHEGYVAKRLECGAVVAAVLTENVVRERPQPGDVVILLGGRTGRDGIGGATGSSKSHDLNSLAAMASEVQKGNAPEERKLQRLFRRGDVTRMIKRCNDFGAGGVSVAIGELAEGVSIDLDAVRRKYDGLDGTELAISESQERMAVVVSPEDAERFIAAAGEENLEAYRVAVITESPRMVMRWKGQTIADISRAFLDTNGAAKHTAVSVAAVDRAALGKTGLKNLREVAASLKSASRRGLVERFDSTVGAGSVTVPFGGRTQTTPAQSMAALLPVLPGQKTEQASVMAYGFDADQMTVDPFVGAYHSVIVSAAKLVAAGADYRKAYLTFQEFFEKLRDEPLRWGKPFAALLGALEAQMDLGAAAIGGKDSMSGSFDDMDVPPTLVSFAIAPQDASRLISPEFKAAGHPVYFFDAPYNQDGTPDYTTLKFMWNEVANLIASGKAVSAWALSTGGIAEGVCKMALGNKIGFKMDDSFPADALYLKNFGGILIEAASELPAYWLVGYTTDDEKITVAGESVTLDELTNAFEGKLESVFPTKAAASDEHLTKVSFTERNAAAPAVKSAKPLAVIPVFPGTNCEYDTARAVENAGGAAEIVVVRNFSADALRESAEQLENSIRKAQMVILPGGFSGGDEPDGSGKFIASFLRDAGIKDSIHELLNKRDGLMLGICNGFQALIKLGLVPYGEIRDEMTGDDPTLTFNLIGRHQSRYATTRVASVKSPWLSSCNVGDLHSIAFSHGEGRFVAPQNVIDDLIKNGQVAFQYTDLNGDPSMDIAWNPNGSMCAIEGITSPDGRVLGKMGHTERYSPFVGKNIYGEKYQPLFANGVKSFK